ncbi:MAG: hypothetical protein R2911_17055 [Caldilineaceae bacterium]
MIVATFRWSCTPPINPATLLAEYLFQPELETAEGEPLPRTVICTSATLSTNRQFAHFKQRCGVAVKRAKIGAAGGLRLWPPGAALSTRAARL